MDDVLTLDQLSLPETQPAPDVLSPEEFHQANQREWAKLGFERARAAAPKQQTRLDYTMERLPVAGAFYGGAKAIDLTKSVKRIQDGTADQTDFNIVQYSLNRRQEETDKSWLARTADIITQLPAFAVEFAGTAGAFSAGKTVAQKAATRVLGKAAEEGATGFATKAAVNLAGSAAQTLAMPQRIAQNTAERMAPQVSAEAAQAGDVGQLVFKEGDGFAEALAKGFGDTLIENTSERMGGFLEKATGVTALKTAIARRFMLKTGANASTFGKILKTAGWDGVIGEVLEERAGEVARGATGIGDYGVTGNLIAGDRAAALSQLASEAVAFSVPGAANVAINAPSMASQRLAQLKQLRDSKPFISKEDASANGIPGGTRSEIRKNTDSEIKQLEQEIQNASTVRSDQAEVPRGQVQGGQDLRGNGQVEVPAKPKSQVASKGPEVQVDPLEAILAAEEASKAEAPEPPKKISYRKPPESPQPLPAQEQVLAQGPTDIVLGKQPEATPKPPEGVSADAQAAAKHLGANQSDIIPVYRGTGEQGATGLKATEGGAMGDGVYFYTAQKPAESHVSAGKGRLVVGYVDRTDPAVKIGPEHEHVIGPGMTTKAGYSTVVVSDASRVYVPEGQFASTKPPESPPTAPQPLPTPEASSEPQVVPEAQEKLKGRKVTKEQIKQDATNGILAENAHNPPWEKTKEEYIKEIVDANVADNVARRKRGLKDILTDKQTAIMHGNAAKTNHEFFVRKALAAGKPVPPEVLADYPDLQPKPPSPEPIPLPPVEEKKAEIPTQEIPSEQGQRTVESDRPPLSKLGKAGSEGGLVTAEGKTRPVRYIAVEADEIIPSHDARRAFTRNEHGDENERPYHDPKQGAASRNIVLDIAKIDPKKLSMLLSDNPTPNDGPPITTDTGVVLGGNARSMGMQLAYHNGGEAGERLKQAVVAAAGKFGIDSKAVEGMKQPVIVRVLDNPGERGELSALLNESLAASKSQATIAVSQGKRVSSETAGKISTMLEPEGESVPTIREVLSSPGKAERILHALKADGAWSDREIDLYTDPTGTLNDDGKAAIEKLLLGKLISDPSVVGDATPGVRQKLIAALGPLVRGMSDETHGKRIAHVLKSAVEAFAGYKAESLPLERYFMGQKAMFDIPGQGDYAVAGMVHALDTLGPQKFKNAIDGIVKSLGIKSGTKTKSLFADQQETVDTIEEAIHQEISPPLKFKPKTALQQAADKESDEGEGVASLKPDPKPTRQTRSSTPKKTGEVPVAEADIQKTAERLFNVAIRQGGFSDRATGIYKWLSGKTTPPSPEVIRTGEDYYAALGVVAHEIAHHIDEKTKAVKGMPKAVKSEIKRLDYEPQKARTFEGWAEFLRRYMTEPAIDINGKQIPNPGIDAPQTLAWFESEFLPKHPEVAKSIAEFRGYAQQFAEQSAFARLASLISDKQPKDLSFKEEWLRKSRRFLNRLKTDFVDKFHTLEWIQEEAKRLGHKGIGIYDLTMAYFLSASSHATIAFEEGVKSLQTGKPLGETTLWGLRDHLTSDGEYEDAVIYAAARHALFMEEKKPGYNTAFDLEDAENWMKEVEESGRTERFEAFAKDLATFNNDLLKMLVEAGALPQDQANNMLRYYGGKNYFPLHRVREGDQGRFAGTGVGFVNLGKAVRGRSAKGSGRQIIDPIDATVAQAMRFYARAIQARQQHVLAETLDPKLGGVGGMGGLMDRVDPRRKVTQGTIGEILDTLVEEDVVEKDDARAMKIAAQLLNEPEMVSEKSLEWFAERHGIEVEDGEVDVDSLMEAAQKEPDALAVISLWRPDYTPNASKRTVLIYDKQGNPLMYEMDKDLYATATGMDEIQFGPFMSMFRAAARWFKTGAVGASTGFGTANLLRDYWEFQGKARHTKGLATLGKPVEMLGRYIAEKARKLAGHEANDPLIRLYEESGGKVYSIVGQDAESRQRYRRRRIGKSVMSKLGIALERPGDSAESVLQGMMDVIAVSDAPPRLADAEAAIKEEGFEIRNGSWYNVDLDQPVDRLPEHVRIKAAVAMAEATINFKRIGAKGQYIEAFLPFFNATVQAQYRQWQQIKGLKSLGKKDVEGVRAARYVVYLSALASTGVLYWLLRHDDDDWREQEAHLRDGYWTWGWNGKTYIKIPKPRDTAIVTNLVENMLDAWYHKDARNQSDVVLRDLGGRLPAGGGLSRGLLETYVADYDYFRGRDLTPEYLKDLPKEQQTTPYTSRASNAIGKYTGRYLGTSPIQVDHLLTSSSGGFYHRMTDLYDSASEGRLGPEHIPFLRGLLLDRHQARSVSDFYTKLEELKTQGHREKADTGKVSDETVRKQAVLDGYAEMMTDIRKLEKNGGTGRRDYQYQPYIVGLARATLGYDELEANPNPLTAKDVPDEVKAIVGGYLRRTAKAASEPLQNRSEYKSADSYERQRLSIVRAKAKLQNIRAKK